MEHSTRFEKVKSYYDSGLWNEERIKNAVIKDWITTYEYKEIIGKDYVK